MQSESITFKMATLIQKLAIAIGGLLMLASVLLEKANRHEQAMLSGGLVGLCFFLIAISSAVKTFSRR